MVSYARSMHEELPKNEDTIFDLQTKKVKRSRGHTRNCQRCYVSAVGLIMWMLIAMVCLELWLLRLLHVIELPF